MIKHGKKYKKAFDSLNSNKKNFNFTDAVNKVKELSYAKFDESIDLDINLSIDPSKTDQVVRNSILLPYSKKANPVIIVFAKNEFADIAKKSGADIVGDDDLIEKIEKGWIDFNFAIATPDMMSAVGKLAKILGPKGLLPSKKLGTVTTELEKTITELKLGKSFFKNDKYGLIHFSIGKKSFDNNKLYENFKVFIKKLSASKPATSKGKFIKKITISSTTGVGIGINLNEID